MHFRSKLTSEICPKLRSLDEKTEQNRLKVPPLPLSKNHCIYLKTKNISRLSIVKISLSTNFMCLRKKVPLEICQKVVSFDLRTALK